MQCWRHACRSVHRWTDGIGNIFWCLLLVSGRFPFFLLSLSGRWVGSRQIVRLFVKPKMLKRCRSALARPMHWCPSSTPFSCVLPTQLFVSKKNGGQLFRERYRCADLCGHGMLWRLWKFAYGVRLRVWQCESIVALSMIQLFTNDWPLCQLYFVFFGFEGNRLEQSETLIAQSLLFCFDHSSLSGVCDAKFIWRVCNTVTHGTQQTQIVTCGLFDASFKKTEQVKLSKHFRISFWQCSGRAKESLL